MFSLLIFLTLTCSILNVEYDLDSGSIKYIGSLNKNTKYAFYIKAEDGESLEIKIYMDYMSTKPFDRLVIDELLSKQGTSVNYDSIYVTNSKENGMTVISKTYSVWSSLTKYVEIKITPNYNISNFKILVTVSGTTTSTIILLATLLPFLFCLIFFIVIFIICRIIYKKNQSTKYNNLGNQPLYTQTQYASPQIQLPPQYPSQPQYSSQMQYLPQQQYAPIQPQGGQQLMAPGQLYQ